MANANAKVDGYIYAPDDVAKRVRDLAHSIGFRKAADALLADKATVFRICCNQVIRRGTVALLQQRITELDAKKTEAEPAT